MYIKLVAVKNNNLYVSRMLLLFDYMDTQFVNKYVHVMIYLSNKISLKLT